MRILPRLSPTDVLQEGTQVQLGNKRGFVISHKIVNNVVIHTVKLTHKRKAVAVNRYEWIECKSEKVEVKLFS